MGLSTLRIRTDEDPCLRKKSVPVKEIGASERMVISAMVETMYQAKGVGLAAPQVGINQRFFVADIGEGPIVFINPEILKKDGCGTLEEGCLSVPGVAIVIDRPEKITVQFTDENDQKVEMNCDGLLARVIQHEMDHLNGVLILDYASDEEKVQFKEKFEDLKAQQKE